MFRDKIPSCVPEYYRSKEEKEDRQAELKRELMDKSIKTAIYDVLKMIVERRNYGMFAEHRPSNRNVLTLSENKITFDNDFVLQNGEPIFEIQHRFASRKIAGMYKELLPNLVSLDPDRSNVSRCDDYNNR